MFNVFLILFAFVIQQAAYLLRDLTLIAKGAHGFVYLVPVLSLSVMLVFWLYGRVFCLILRRKFERWPYHRDKYYILSRKFGFSYKVMLLASYIAILVVFNWRGFALRYTNVFFVEILVELAPFFALLVISWINSHRLDGIFSARKWTRRQYIDFQIRQISIIIVTMLSFSLVYEIIAQMPSVNIFLTLYPEAMMLAFIPLMLIVYSLIPLLARFMWKVESLPQGPLRDRLEALGQRNGVKVRDILLWHTGGGWIVNAAAIGIFPRLRYVVLTDGLVRSLEPEEVEAVYGHELGHAHYAHIAYYAAFLISMSFLTMYIMGMEFLQVNSEILAVILQFIISFGLFIGVVFGFVSRRFEREADLFGSKIVGNPQIFVEALEKVSSHGGNMRKMPSWSHSSIERRVNFLNEAKENPDKARKFEKQTLTIRAIILLVAISCVLYSVSRFVTMPRSERVMAHINMYAKMINETKDIRKRIELYAYIGDMALQEGRASEAKQYLNNFYSQTPTAVDIIRESNLGVPESELAADIKKDALDYLERGWIALAINALRCAREFDPDGTLDEGIVADLRDAAMDRRESGEYRKAMQILKGAEEFLPQSPEILFDVGMLHYKKATDAMKPVPGESKRAFEKRIAIVRAELVQAARDFDGSLANGGDTQAALFIGRCQYFVGDWLRCLKAYRRYSGVLDKTDTAFLTQAKHNIAAGLLHGNAFHTTVANYIQIGRGEKFEPFVFKHFAVAEELLANAEKLSSNDEEPLAIQKWAEAISEYEIALVGFDGDNPVVLIRLALLLYEHGGREGKSHAEGLITRAVESPIAMRRYYGIGAWAMRRIGRKALADEYSLKSKTSPNQIPLRMPANPPHPQP